MVRDSNRVGSCPNDVRSSGGTSTRWKPIRVSIPIDRKAEAGIRVSQNQGFNSSYGFPTRREWGKSAIRGSRGIQGFGIPIPWQRQNG